MTIEMLKEEFRKNLETGCFEKFFEMIEQYGQTQRDEAYEACMRQEEVNRWNDANPPD